jgi:hypothetical protein
MTDSANESDNKSRNRKLDAAIVAAVIAAIATIITAIVGKLPIGPSPNPGKSPASSSSSSPIAGSPVPVRTAVVRYTEGKGLNTFSGPGNTYLRGNPANLSEGTVIQVTCQERHGQSVYDPEGDERRYKHPWPVWDKLSSGLWVADLYTDLPKYPGENPPDGVPRCQ